MSRDSHDSSVNDSKTGVVNVTFLFTPTEPINSVTIRQSAISPSDDAGNLGVIFDKHVLMTAHMNKLSQHGLQLLLLYVLLDRSESILIVR